MPTIYAQSDASAAEQLIRWSEMDAVLLELRREIEWAEASRLQQEAQDAARKAVEESRPPVSTSADAPAPRKAGPAVPPAPPTP